MPRAADAVAAAKLWLVSEQTAGLPYLARGLYALVTVETDDVRTLSADEHWRLYVNPTWVVTAPVDRVARALAHQLWHLLLEHADRARAVGVDASTARAWHRATDLALVDALAPEGCAPAELVAAAAALRAQEAGRLPPGRPAEEYWATLSRLSVEPDDEDEPDGDDEGDGDGDEGSAADGRSRPWELPADADVGGVDPAAGDVIRRAVAIEYSGRRGGRGSTPGEVARWVKRMTEPTLPWEHLLAQAARRGIGWTSGRTHTTWTRPNRRASATPGVLQPGWRRPHPRVAMVVDTSMSVDDHLLGKAMGEVDGALRSLGVGGPEVTVLACDAAVQAVTRVRRARDAALAGGGGTDLRVALATVEDLRPRPSLVVVFTDGYTPWPVDPPPGCAVVVALLARPGEELPDVPGWASAVRCELDD